MLSDRCPVCPVLSICNVGVLWPNSWMDQDETWHGGRPRSRPHCVRFSFPLKGTAPLPPIFGPCLLWPNGWMDQDATWYVGSLSPGNIVLDGDPAPRKGAQQLPTSFQPMCVVAKWSPISSTAELLSNFFQWKMPNEILII